MTVSIDRKSDEGFTRWYRSSGAFRRSWVPNGIDQLGILRSLYRHRKYAKGVLLDVGCGTKKFADLYSEKVIAYLGVDLFSAQAHLLRTIDVYGDASQLPIKSSSVATVIAIQVLGCIYEHDAMLREIERVLQPGGYLILTYSQGGGQSSPTDYFRFTPAFYQKAFALTGLLIEVLEARTGTMGTIGENLSEIIYYSNSRPGPVSRMKRLVCHLIEQSFSLMDRIFYDPHGGTGHTVVARKPLA